MFLRILIIWFMLCSSVFAEPVYLWVKKTDERDESKGDVLAITPATAQYEPTASELIQVYVIKTDLTKEEQNELLAPQVKEEVIDFNGEKIPKETVVFPREKKIDVDSLNIKNLKEEFTKNEVFTKAIDKPVAVVSD